MLLDARALESYLVGQKQDVPPFRTSQEAGSQELSPLEWEHLEARN